MYEGLDDDPESTASLARGDPADDETVRSGTLSKLRREIRSLWNQAPAGVDPPAGVLKLSDVPDVLLARDLPAFRRRIQKLRHWAKNKPGDGPSDEPRSDEPPEPPKPVSTDPGESGKASAAPAPPDEAEQMRRALKSFRKDAVLSRVVAEARPFEPARVIDALDDLVEIDDDGALSLVDPESNERLPLDAATLRRLIPDAVPPPPGAGPGSGGKKPAEYVPGAPGAAADIIERAMKSQAFYDAHRLEVDAELRRRGRL